jgi:CheY-like chemotaxis protein
MATKHIFEGLRVLVVEDEMIIAEMIEMTLLDVGAEVVGPVARLDAAMRLAAEESIDAAVLDINIRGGSSYGVADILAERDIPFVLCSGYGNWALEERYRDRPRLTKPYTMQCLVAALDKLLDTQTG